MYVCVCIYIYTYIHTYIYIYVYTYTRRTDKHTYTRRTDTQAQDARRLAGAGAGWGATCLTFYPPLTLGVRGRLVVIETT